MQDKRKGSGETEDARDGSSESARRRTCAWSLASAWAEACCSAGRTIPHHDARCQLALSLARQVGTRDASQHALSGAASMPGISSIALEFITAIPITAQAAPSHRDHDRSKSIRV